MNEFEKKKLQSCLECAIGHNIILRMRYIYGFLLSEREKWREEEADDTEKEMINQSAAYLGLKGNFEKICESLFSLTLNKAPSGQYENEEESVCMASLRNVMNCLEPIYTDVEELYSMVPARAKIVFAKMNSINAQAYAGYRDGIDNDVIKKLNNKKYAEKNMGHIHKTLKKVYERYSSEENPYKFENKAGRCEPQIFLDITNKDSFKADSLRRGIKQREKNIFFARADKLCSQSKHIIEEYIMYAPKEFGCTLGAVMQEQKMTEQNLSNFTGIKANAVQSLLQSKKPQRPQEDISLIARALLVSEDVLYCGTGKIYGNWMDFESKETVDGIIEKTGTLKNKNGAKSWIRESINNIIRKEPDEFQQLMKDNPDSFIETDYAAYPDVEDAYYALLNPREAETLLDVLEKMEPQPDE